ncbi:tetratricopeptide repeat protein [Candidatus Riflebacteria bacterium]
MPFFILFNFSFLSLMWAIPNIPNFEKLWQESQDAFYKDEDLDKALLLIKKMKSNSQQLPPGFSKKVLGEFKRLQQIKEEILEREKEWQAGGSTNASFEKNLEQAFFYMNIGFLKKAKLLLNHFVLNLPEDPEKCLLLAGFFFKIGEYKQSEALLKPLFAHKLNSSIRDLLFENLFEIYFKMGDYERAKSVLIKGKKEAYKSPFHIINMVKVFLKQDKKEFALRLVENAIKEEPDFGLHYIAAVRIFMATKNLEKAAEYLDRALLTVQLDPGSKWNQVILSLTAKLRKEMQKATAAGMESFTAPLLPSSSNGNLLQRKEKAILLMQKGDLAEAIFELENILKEEPAYVEARILLASFLYKSGLFREAAKAAEFVLDNRLQKPYFEEEELFWLDSEDGKRGKMQKNSDERNSAHILLIEIYERLNMPEKVKEHLKILKKTRFFSQELQDLARKKMDSIKGKKLK